MQEALLILTSFNILFYYESYSKPLTMATSELLSTFFPTWLWQGRMWSKWRLPKYDHYYWLNTHAHPVLSTYYPVGILTSIVGSRLSLNAAFSLLAVSLNLHHLFGSIGWFVALQRWMSPEASLLAAITISYSAYHQKQQPCIVYTLAWFPWILTAHSILCPIAIGMVLLAGYYPLAIYLLPSAIIATQTVIPLVIGLIIALPQLIPFLRYLPKTIRSAKSEQPEVGPSETNFYIGILPIILLIMNPQWRYLWILAPIMISYLFQSFLPRVRQRLWIISSYLAITLSFSFLPKSLLFPLLILQCLDLYLHNRLLPTRPFCELQRVPERVFNSKMMRYLKDNIGDARVSGLPFPLFTGLVNEIRTIGYCGGMQLKLMAKWRNDRDPNGSGHHDFFIANEDNSALDTGRVKFAFTRKGIDWPSTGFKHLYRNPRM